MYKQLTTDHALFIVEESDLQHYLAIVSNCSFDQTLEQSMPLATIDNWNVSFDIWCMLNENTHNFLLNEQKALAYGSNFYCLDILCKNKRVQDFYRAHAQDEKMLVIFSYYLAVEMLQWTKCLLESRPEGIELMARNKHRNYFLLYQEEGILDDPHHMIYIEQKLTTSLLAQDFNHTDTFHRHVKSAIRQTQKHL